MIEVAFEVKSTVELWRRPYCIFTVSYPTTTTVCVQGLRGNFKISDARALNNVFFRRGFTSILFERLVDDILVERVIPLVKLYRNVDATQFTRQT